MLPTTHLLSHKHADCSEQDLEQLLIAEYLFSKGFRSEDLYELPEDQRKALMKDACLNAALRLAEIQAKSKFRESIKAPG